MNSDFKTRYAERLRCLNDAFCVGDEEAFSATLDSMLEERGGVPLREVTRLSESLLLAMMRFRSDSRIATLAVQDIPHAQLRLDRVLAMTEEAAHRTLDIIEKSAPLAEATARGAKQLAETLDERSHVEIRQFLGEVRSSAEQVRNNLMDVMIAQGFQDLTGQILRGVRTLIGEVEAVLEELASITGVPLLAPPEKAPDATPEGPAIPGITRNAVADQSDVDDLIAGLGI
jgi:chemotaxis protein CheZ